MDKFTLYPDDKYDNHSTNELHLEGSSSEGLEKAVKQYIKDCVALKFPTSNAKLKETDIRAAFLAGSEWMEEELIVWLKNHINDYIVKGRDIDLMFDDLHKAMEE